MSDPRLTSDNFDKSIRDTLRYRHGFEREDLERTKTILSEAVEHIESQAETKLGMGAKHLDMAMKFLNEDHKGWKKLPEHQRKNIEIVLKEHLGIGDD